MLEIERMFIRLQLLMIGDLSIALLSIAMCLYISFPFYVVQAALAAYFLVSFGNSIKDYLIVMTLYRMKKEDIGENNG